mgnify:CR=1 FL=1
MVTLPGRRRLAATNEYVNYLKQGQNTIAIALISENAATQRASLFDTTVRLMTDEPESHVWEFTAEMSGIIGNEAAPFDQYHSYYLKYTSCSPNWYILRFEKDRREWINSVQIQNYYLENVESVRQFRLYARNREEEPWTLLKNVTGLVYTMAAQRRRVYLANDQPYNQFRFEDFATGKPKECKWRLQSLNLIAENVMNELAPLVYPQMVTAYRNVEMAEVFAKSEVKVWECRNCGHIVIGKKAPEVCPVCAHPQAYFQLRAENY